MIEPSQPLELPTASPWYRLGPVLIAATVYVLCIGHPRLWDWSIWPQSMARFGATFLDMNSHLAIGQAVARHEAVPGQIIPADLMQRIYFGPKSLYWYGYFAPSPSYTLPLAVGCVVGFLLTIVLLFRPHNLAESGYLMATLVSPPVLLLVERGNIDLLVFSVLAGAFTLMARPRPAQRWAGWAIVTAFIGFKYYPAVAYAGYLGSGASRREKSVALGLGLVAVTAFLVLTREEVHYLATHQFDNRFYPFFGVRELWIMVGQTLARAAWIGLGAWLIGTGALAWLLGPLERVAPAFDVRQTCFVGGASMLVFCFIFTSSPDYRLVHFLFCLPWLAVLIRRDGLVASRCHRIAMLCLVLFLAVPWFGTLGVRSAVALDSPGAWSAVLFLKQFGWWFLMVCLGALLLRMLAARGLELLGRSSPAQSIQE